MVRTIFDGDVWASAVKGDSGEVVRPSSNDMDDGWLTAAYPNRKWDNWAKLALFEACQWIEEKGVFDWDLNITYSTGALVNYSGKTYISILASNLNQQPDTATTYWQNYYDWLIDKAGQTLVVADESSLGTGVVDGQIRGTVAGNLYTWDETDTKWNGRSGNNYSSNPAFGNVQWETGATINVGGASKRYNGSTWDEFGAVSIGALERPFFEAVASSTTLNLVGPGGYHLYGKGWVWWDSTIAKTLSSLTTDTWTYVYIDESTVTSAGKITASNIIDSTTAPAYSTTNGGYYNGDDRCIFAVYGTGSSSYRFFYHDGSEEVHYEEKIADVTSFNPSTTWTDKTLTTPGFTKRALVNFQYFYDTAAASLKWRKNGSASDGHIVCRVASNADSEYNQVPVYMDSGQTIEVASSAASGTTLGINTAGYYLPKGL